MLKTVLRRREFLSGGLALMSLSDQAMSAASDEPATHNCLLVGTNAAFLSHLPMFDHLNASGTEYVTPHRYQAILQVTFERAARDVTDLYFADRESHRDTKMFTISPTETFVLPSLMADQPAASFNATVFRGHLERGGQAISELSGVTVKIAKVIHFHKFEPSAQPPDSLNYLVFGSGQELFLAHSIAKPPNFDQIISIEVIGAGLPDQTAVSATMLHVRDRKDTAPERLLEGQQITAELSTGATVVIKGIREFYFEEGELLMPPTFRATKEETKAGF